MNYLNLNDFLLGQYVEIFNRRFFLYDCDSCTKKFYQQYVGQCDFIPIDIEDKQCRKITNVRLPPVPPHPMFGQPDDTIQNVKYLVPRPQRKNRIKLTENQHRVLRYAAIMVTIDHEYRDRMLLISQSH
jgi:EF-hand domain-containing protein 1